MIEQVTLRLNGGSELQIADSKHCHELNPKAMMLFAAAKCAGLTVLEIMKRERLHPKGFEITLSGEMSTETVRAETIFKSFHASYNIECDTTDDQAKASRAVTLAHDKYCGMMQMLRQIGSVTREIAVVTTTPMHA